ncbi:class I SAM-dependent methyltransferase [Corynebacterium sp.]|uniref:class I SAM-dependent methyltransferase n=1 Tax=Corynebacterium sp. TaxID=1720 RepID=UPI003B3B5545
MTYTHGHGPAALANHVTRTAQDSVAFVLPYLHRDSRVLDVGCGPGSITLDLAALIAGEGGAASQVIGVENTPAPVEAAQQLAHQRGIGAVFMTGDARALPFPDGTFDIVVAHQVLQHLGDPVAALREFARVTAPGGVVAVRDADYDAMFFHPQPAGLLDWQRDYRRRARANGGEPDAGRYLLQWARAAGFGAGQLTYSTTTWQYSSGAGASWLADNWVRRTCDSDAVTAEATDRICAGWRTWSEDAAAVFVMPHGELLIRV